VHAYTATQALVDSPGGAKDLRRGRAAAQSFVPSSTGAASATAKALPAMEGRFDGVAVRGPVVVGSISDVVIVVARDTTPDEVNEVLRQASTDGTRESSPSPTSRWSRPTSSRTPGPPSSSWT
jgi:glyceraldehyde 3-phosphate dehydrogenase